MKVIKKNECLLNECVMMKMEEDKLSLKEYLYLTRKI